MLAGITRKLILGFVLVFLFVTTVKRLRKVAFTGIFGFTGVFGFTNVLFQPNMPWLHAWDRFAKTLEGGLRRREDDLCVAPRLGGGIVELCAIDDQAGAGRCC